MKIIRYEDKNTRTDKELYYDQIPHLGKLLCITVLFCLSFVILNLGLHNNLPQTSANKTATGHQKEIASKVIRLHVIANSNSITDQSLKFQLRDAVLGDMQHAIPREATLSQARKILKKSIPGITLHAEEFLRSRGCHLPVKVTIKNEQFPAKTYGDLTFPGGIYEALCIRIGTASGQNWWCVLFPSLCFVDETHGEVPPASKKKLQKTLSKKAYSALQTKPIPTCTPQVEFHSALYDWAKSR